MATDYERFVKQCKKTLRALGIDGAWDLRFLRGKSSDRIAECALEVGAHMGEVTFFEHSRTMCEPARAARHEMAHVLLAELSELARNRYATEGEIMRAEESICIVLEKVLP